jgi:CheY-like chemotaxis protein
MKTIIAPSERALGIQQPGAKAAALILLILLICAPKLSIAAEHHSSIAAINGEQQDSAHFSARETPFHAVVASQSTILIGLVLSVGAVLSVWKLASKKKAITQTQSSHLTKAGADAAETQIEQNSEAKTATMPKGGPESMPTSGSASSTATATPLQMLLKLAPERIEAIRTLFSRVSKAADASARQTTLGELSAEVRQFSGLCDSPQLEPVRQLSTALTGLLTQLIQKPVHMTPSTLRTTAGAIVLLESLCKPDLEPNLLTEPPVRLLAIDDDPVSRAAVSVSLSKSLGQPDLAEHGEAGLTLALEKPYDVIFMDVEMPGLDGYEVCSQIHKQGANVKTPVVFVTCHSDFDSRAKSAEAGGHDLIAKPFLGFEITVKALTLVLRNRLQSRDAKERRLSAVLQPANPRASNNSIKAPGPTDLAEAASQVVSSSLTAVASRP